ncbi:hypothetical protein [Robbsia andropogonis]|uniref:hypothetical protein n=1 Tax=Robbsia andropogonis TaxID=28092 RepID=UPI0004BC0130|nr:hypothetical protein [Robbsia andropogonis]
MFRFLVLGALIGLSLAPQFFFNADRDDPRCNIFPTLAAFFHREAVFLHSMPERRLCGCLVGSLFIALIKEIV